tara:strand:+ start:89 stop:247 length:159 start_codon:yes stop_codon:yes gene_type:complete
VYGCPLPAVGLFFVELRLFLLQQGLLLAMLDLLGLQEAYMLRQENGQVLSAR